MGLRWGAGLEGAIELEAGRSDLCAVGLLFGPLDVGLGHWAMSGLAVGKPAGPDVGLYWAKIKCPKNRLIRS